MRTKWLWILWWGGVLTLLLSCQDEIALPQDATPVLASPSERLRQALDRDYYATSLRSGGLDTANRRLSFDDLEPAWASAKTFKTHGRYTVLRVPVVASAYWGRVTDEMTEEIGRKYPEANKTFLVRVEDQDHPEGRNYFMHLVPSLDFLERGLPLESENSLVPQGFDGEVELYHLNGRILSRELYRQGKRYKRYTYPDEGNEAGLRSATGQDGGYDCIKVRYTREYSYIDNDEVVVVAERKEYERCYPRLGGANNGQQTAIIDEGGGGGSFHSSGIDSAEWERRLGERHIAELMSSPDSIIADSTEKISKEALKRRIDSVYTEMTKDCFFAALVEGLKGMEGKRAVISKIRLLSNLPGTASYNTRNELAFQTVENIVVSSMSHEMIHAYQFRHHRLDTMKSEARVRLFGMIEFERALMQNLLDYIACAGNHEALNPKGERYTWFAENSDEPIDGRIEGRTTYVDWLHTLTNGGTQLPDEIDEKRFYHFSNEFGKHYRGYGTRYGYVYGDSIGYKPTAIQAMIQARKQFNDCK